VYGDLASAVAAAASGDTVYVCAGSYNMETPAYAPNYLVDITESLTIDGYDWDSPPSGTDTSSSVDPTTQSVFENGSGILVQSQGVTISGLTFEENNNDAPNLDFECLTGQGCGTSIDVQSLVSGPGDQGESNVTISNNLLVNTGGSNTLQNGDVHIGLGEAAATSNETTADVTALDTNDVVEGNVFINDVNYENNALQMADTSGALVADNTVNYPTNNVSGSDDYAYSALSLTGFNQGTSVSSNTLNGGGIDNDSGAIIDASDPISGIKLIDAFGNGCSDQNITHNTITGFVDDISVISSDNNTNNAALCSVGPTDFSVSNNSVSDSRIYGIYLSVDSTSGTLNDNVAADTDSEGYSPESYAPGDYDYFDASGDATNNAWNTDTGNGTSSPASIEATSPPPPPPPPPATTTTTTTSPPPTTTTTPPEPSISISGVVLTSGDRVLATVRCVDARCAGLFKITKTITMKIAIGHPKKYKLVTRNVVLGTASYSLAEGTDHQFSIQLNALGVKLLKSSVGRLKCELMVTSAGGTKHEPISLSHS